MEEPTKDVGEREDETGVKPSKGVDGGGTGKESASEEGGPTKEVGEPKGSEEGCGKPETAASGVREAAREVGEPAEKEAGAGTEGAEAARGVGRNGAEPRGSEEGGKVLEPTTDVGEPTESSGDGSEARVREPAIDVGDALSMLSTGTSDGDGEGGRVSRSSSEGSREIGASRPKSAQAGVWASEGGAQTPRDEGKGTFHKHPERPRAQAALPF